MLSMASLVTPKLNAAGSRAFIGLVLLPTVWLTIIAGTDAYAADGNEAKSDTSVKLASEVGGGVQPTIDVAHWIAQLGAADFRRREDATQRLLSAGPEVIGPIAKAAQ